MDVTESNKLIAEFMVPEFVKQIPSLRDGTDEEGIEVDEWMVEKMALYSEHYDLLKYHKSWDRLMSVVDRIECEGHRFLISTTFVRMYTDKYEEYNCSVFGGKLNATYHAVVEFINWYNDER